MRVEILTERLNDRDQGPGGQHYRAEKGDVFTVPDPYGRKLCALGWAKDITEYASEDERVPSGEAVPGARPLARAAAGRGPAR